MKKIMHLINTIFKGFDFLSPLVDLAVRLYVGMVFWKSGLVKIANLDTTIWLFANEYHVPILSPEIAAYLSTASELIFSALLMIGLLGRVSALVLFIINFIAVLSYPTLHETGIEWHIAWGLLLLIPLFHGPGKLSVDYFVWKVLEKWSSKK